MYIPACQNMNQNSRTIKVIIINKPIKSPHASPLDKSCDSPAVTHTHSFSSKRITGHHSLTPNPVWLTENEPLPNMNKSLINDSNDELELAYFNLRMVVSRVIHLTC